jgi:hypothetical protein
LLVRDMQFYLQILHFATFEYLLLLLWLWLEGMESLEI